MCFPLRLGLYLRFSAKAWHSVGVGQLKALSHEVLNKTPSGAAEEIRVIQRNQRVAKQIARRTGSDG